MRTNSNPVGELGAQEDDRVAEREAVLGRPERDDVDTAVGGERLERDAERGGGVREAGTVDVEQHAELVGPLGDRAGLLERVDGPELRRLGHRDDALLGVVVVAAAGLPAAEVVGRELPVLGGDGVELGAGDPLGCAALVDVHVRGVGADHRLEAARERVEGGDVGPGPVEDGEVAGVRTEVGAEELLDPLRPRVAAIGTHVALVRGGDRSE